MPKLRHAAKLTGLASSAAGLQLLCATLDPSGTLGKASVGAMTFLASVTGGLFTGQLQKHDEDASAEPEGINHDLRLLTAKAMTLVIRETTTEPHNPEALETIADKVEAAWMSSEVIADDTFKGFNEDALGQVFAQPSADFKPLTALTVQAWSELIEDALVDCDTLDPPPHVRRAAAKALHDRLPEAVRVLAKQDAAGQIKDTEGRGFASLQLILLGRIAAGVEQQLDAPRIAQRSTGEQRELLTLLRGFNDKLPATAKHYESRLRPDEKRAVSRVLEALHQLQPKLDKRFKEMHERFDETQDLVTYQTKQTRDLISRKTLYIFVALAVTCLICWAALNTFENSIVERTHEDQEERREKEIAAMRNGLDENAARAEFNQPIMGQDDSMLRPVDADDEFREFYKDALRRMVDAGFANETDWKTTLRIIDEEGPAALLRFLQTKVAIPDGHDASAQLFAETYAVAMAAVNYRAAEHAAQLWTTIAENDSSAWNAYGLALSKLANFDGALFAYRKAERIDRAAFSDNHPNVATCLNNIATVLAAQNDLPGVLSAYREAERIWRSAYGNDHPKVAIVLINIGSALQNQGNFTGAEATYLEAERLLRAAFSDDHPKVAIVLNNIGSLHYAQRDLVGALSAFREANRINLAHFDENHPNIARDHNSIGTVFLAQGRNADALTEFHVAKRIWQYAYGNDHPNVASAVNNIGAALLAQGDRDGALAAYREAERIGRAAYGNNHSNVAIRINNVGEALIALGDLDGALSLFREAERIDRAAFGDNHYKVARDVSNIGGVLKAQGDFGSALDAYREGVQINRAVFGDNHPDVAGGIYNIGGILLAQGDFTGALTTFRDAERIFRAALGDDHQKVAIVSRNIGGVLLDQDDLSGALAAYREAERIDRAAPGDDRLKLAEDVFHIGSILRAQGDLEGALLAYREVESIWRIAWADDDPNIATVVYNIGSICRLQGDFTSALSAFRDAEHVFRAALGDDHPKVAIVVGKIGNVLQDQDDLPEALAAYREAERINREAFGDDHPDVASELNNIGSVLFAQGKRDEALMCMKEAFGIYLRFFGPQAGKTVQSAGNLELLEIDPIAEARRIAGDEVAAELQAALDTP